MSENTLAAPTADPATLAENKMSELIAVVNEATEKARKRAWRLVIVGTIMWIGGVIAANATTGWFNLIALAGGTIWGWNIAPAAMLDQFKRSLAVAENLVWQNPTRRQSDSLARAALFLSQSALIFVPTISAAPKRVKTDDAEFVKLIREMETMMKDYFHQLKRRVPDEYTTVKTNGAYL